jgi:hypothetical protein
MAAPIRPNFTPVNPQLQNPANNQARSAAQRAFFEAALGKAQGQSTPQPQAQGAAQGSAQATRATQAQATAQTAPLRSVSPAAAQAAYVPKIPKTLPAEPPTRILRPGSILDIKV